MPMWWGQGCNKVDAPVNRLRFTKLNSELDTSALAYQY